MAGRAKRGLARHPGEDDPVAIHRPDQGDAVDRHDVRTGFVSAGGGLRLVAAWLPDASDGGQAACSHRER